MSTLDTATDTNPQPPLLIVSGLSGSGKSVALRTLEDLGYYCVDNLPADLLPDLLQSLELDESAPSRLAVGIDVRNRGDLSSLPEALSRTGVMGYQHRLVFLDTRDDVLIHRYSETRRRHPLSSDGMPLAEAIELERQRLKPLIGIADVVLDTSSLNVHQLRRWVATEIVADARIGLSLLVESFAYRHGLPPDADFVFDVRCLPNPHWDPALRPLSGRDGPVREYFAANTDVQEYLGQIFGLLDTWLPKFETDSRSYVTIAFGCTGGRHRSVYCAEALATHWRESGRTRVVSYHREIE